MDIDVLRWFAAHRSPLGSLAMMALTTAGRAGLIWIGLAGWRGLRHRECRSGAWRVVLAVVLALLAADVVLKPLVRRPRPFAVSSAVSAEAARLHDYSFPSGHAASAAAGAVAVGAIWPGARPALWALAFLIGLSRAYLGVHYPSDIVAGWLLGAGVAWLTVRRRPLRLPESRDDASQR